MLVLPLGLGTKLRRLPLVTVLVGCAWVAAFFIDQSDAAIGDALLKTVAATGVRERSRALFIDYCLSRQGSLEKCRKYSVLVWTGFIAPPKEDTPPDNKVTDRGDIKDINPAAAAEFKAAAAIRKELRDCGGSKQCFAYKDIIWRFFDSERHHPAAFTKLAAFGAYRKATATYRANLASICRENDCLVKGNINVASLVFAQLRHGGLSHLFGNLLAFLIFGAYVEQRTSRLVYLAAIILGGTVGMGVHAAFFGGRDMIALGGSANVSAVMGMFFVFFLQARMRFLVWLPRKLYAGTSFFADVRYCFPLLFVLSDINGGFDNGFANLLDGRVAHFAHLSGLLFGAVTAWLIMRWRPLPAPLIFESELDDLRAMVALDPVRQLPELLSRADALVRANPENVPAMEIVVTRLLAILPNLRLEEQPLLVARAHAFLCQFLPQICAVYARKGGADQACELLAAVPLSMPFSVYLNRMGQLSALRLAVHALRRGRPFLAFRLYDFYMTRFPRSVQNAGIERTAREALSHIDPVQSAPELAAFCRFHPQSRLALAVAQVANSGARSA